MNSIVELVIVGLLAAIAGLLSVVVMSTYLRAKYPDFRLAEKLDEATERFGQAVQHYASVNVVLGLLEELETHPDLMDRLSEYSRDVVAAALLARVNDLGGQLRVVQGYLTSEEAEVALGYTSHQRDVKRLTTRIEELTAELLGAQAAVERFTGRAI